jgi:hypothetical protein
MDAVEKRSLLSYNHHLAEALMNRSDVTWRFHIPLCPHYIISHSITHHLATGKSKALADILIDLDSFVCTIKCLGFQRREHQNMPWFGRTATATGVLFMKAGVAWWDLVIIGIELLNMINHALGICTQSRRDVCTQFSMQRCASWYLPLTRLISDKA